MKRCHLHYTSHLFDKSRHILWGYPDHYSFSQEEISKLEKIANEIGCNILTTEKDFMRIKNLKFNNIFSCAVNLTVYNEKKFFSEIRSLYV